MNEQASKDEASADPEDAETDEGPEDAETDEGDARASDDHLQDLDDGAGCTEIWEHLSDRRDDDE